MDDRQRLLAFLEARGMRVVKKSDSRFMRFLSYLLFWNQNFMDGYYTTIGNTVYAPKPEELTVEVLAHEFTHYHDGRAIWIPLWGTLYLFPQVLMPFMFLGFLGLVNPWLYFLFAIVLVLLPWPAPWRYHYELRGYQMSLAVLYWQGGEFRAREAIPFFIRQFTGPFYYFMWPFEKFLQRKFEAWLEKLKSGVGLGMPYDTIHGLLFTDQ